MLIVSETRDAYYSYLLPGAMTTYVSKISSLATGLIQQQPLHVDSCLLKSNAKLQFVIHDCASSLLQAHHVCEKCHLYQMVLLFLSDA